VPGNIINPPASLTKCLVRKEMKEPSFLQFIVTHLETLGHCWKKFVPKDVDANMNVKNRTRRCAIHLRGFSFAQHPILKFRGQGDTHRVKMKSKASSQTTDAVVAEWQSACETHGFAILSQTLRSVLTLPAT
jgi:hypothetical protein